jgi:hypothetical protein
MPVEWTNKPVNALIDSVSSGEIRLPEIQRAYVWKPTQIAKFMESLYRGYPSGALLFWKTTDAPQTRAVASDTSSAGPAHAPLYLLDGQQRLTSLHRVFIDHPEAQIVFNVETEKFQNQSATTRKDRRWIKVFDVLSPNADPFQLREELVEAGLPIPPKEISRRLGRIEKIGDYRYHMEILDGFRYDEVATIFVRVNSGRKLGTLDLAMATLSARWAGVLAKLEKEAAYWAARGYGSLDVNFLSRALAGVVLGRGLSAWSHNRLASATDAELEKGWSTVQRGLKHLIQLLKANLKLVRSDPIPSAVALIPLVVLLGERTDAPMDKDTSNGILYWLLLATIRNRYSGSTDTVLGQDIRAARQVDPVRTLLANLDVDEARLEITERTLAGRTKESPYFFLSLLVAQASGARDWWHGTEIMPGLDGDQKLEHHHIFPASTVDETYDKVEVNELANLAFISAKANRKIGNKLPEEYFPTLDEAELVAQCVPLDPSLRTVDAYLRFLIERRRQLSSAMTDLLGRFRPSWLEDEPIGPADPTDGLSLDLGLYESSWDSGRMVFTASGPDISWTGSASMADLEAAIEAAGLAGIDSDVEIAGESVPVQVVEDSLVVPIGPFLVTGTPEEWRTIFDRERAGVRPLSAAPAVFTGEWVGEQIPFPITSTD